jgi:hypothetical protein
MSTGIANMQTTRTGSETVVIEQLDGRARVVMRDRVRLRPETRTFTIGRSVNADVTLDDEHAAALHAEIEITEDGQVLARDLGSLNGIVAAGTRHRDASGLALTDAPFQIGRTRLRVRTQTEALAAEKPDQLLTGPASFATDPVWLAIFGALACLAQHFYSSWVGAPRDLLDSFVLLVGMSALGLGAWVGLWALLSRLLLGEWRWRPHAAIVLCIGALYVALNGALDVVSFSLSLPAWGFRKGLLTLAALGGVLSLHLIYAANVTPRRAAQIACIAATVIGVGAYWVFERNTWRDVNHINAAMNIYPPALRLHSGESVARYFERATALRAAAERRRQAALLDDADQDED